jgi:hypothetical protein
MSYPQKSLIFGTPMEISSLNVHGHTSAQKKLIITLDGSKCASQQNTQCAIVKVEDGIISGVKFTPSPENSIQWDFQLKHHVE